MKVSLTHVPHIATRIAVDLSRSGLVTMTKGLESTAKEAEGVLTANIKKEMALEEKVKEIVNANEEQIDFYLADERQLFFMIKKKLAPEFGVILSYEERYSDIAHQILGEDRAARAGHRTRCARDVRDRHRHEGSGLLDRR